MYALGTDSCDRFVCPSNVQRPTLFFLIVFYFDSVPSTKTLENDEQLQYSHD